MATIDFPSNPLIGDIWTQNNKSWKWDGTSWESYSDAKFTQYTFPTGSTILSKGTTAERDIPAVSGYIRYNTQTNQFEGYGDAWTTLGSPPIVNDNTTDSIYYPAFVTSATGNASTLRVSSSKLNFNPNSGQLTATSFSGSGLSLTNLNASNITQGTISSEQGVAAGSSVASFLKYSGITKIIGQLYGGSSVPTNTTRLNYDGALYATRFYGDGANLTTLNASSITSGTLSDVAGVAAGSTTPSFVKYSGTTKAAGQFYGGLSGPTNSTRLNYDGHIYATRYYGDGSFLSGLTTNAINDIFWENSKVVSANYTVSSSRNAGTFGPITINTGVTITIPDGSTWTVV